MYVNKLQKKKNNQYNTNNGNVILWDKSIYK